MYIAKMTQLMYIENENKHVIRYAKEVRKFIDEINRFNLFIFKSAIGPTIDEAITQLRIHIGKSLYNYSFMEWAYASLNDFKIKYKIVEVDENDTFDDSELSDSCLRKNECKEAVSLFMEKECL